jgi:hypothetical protein
LIAFFESFFSAMEWFLICEPEMSPLAQAAPPPRATNSATAAITVAGCLKCFTRIPPLVA